MEWQEFQRLKDKKYSCIFFNDSVTFHKLLRLIQRVEVHKIHLPFDGLNWLISVVKDEVKLAQVAAILALFIPIWSLQNDGRSAMKKRYV